MENRLQPRLLKNYYLEGLTLVRNADSIDDIWRKLKKAFGNAEELLKNKLYEMEDLGPMWKLKNPEKLVQSLSKLINAMEELSKIAKKHSIENDLYHGRGLETILSLVGNHYETKFFSDTKNRGLSKKDAWENLVKFLDTQFELQEALVSYHKIKDEKVSKEINTRKVYISKIFPETLKCHICDEDNHVSTIDFRGKRTIQYFV